MSDRYKAFLEDKIRLAPATGFEVDPAELSPDLKPFCRDIVAWALRGGRRAVFASFGLHKTAMQLEYGRQVRRHTRLPFCTVLPLGVRQEFTREVVDRGFDRLGVRLKFVRAEREIEDDPAVHHLTNYETIRDGKLDPKIFGGVTLDEAAVLRSYGSKTYQEFLPLFSGIRFKMPATATPDPNRIKELIHYAGFLEVMDTGQALTRFFQRDSTQANELTLYPHKEEEFWLWVSSWAVMIQRPSDLGYPDDGYVMPPLEVTWHEVPSDHATAAPERDGQGVLIKDSARGLKDAAEEKRASIGARVARMVELIEAEPATHRILWHHLEDERHAIQQARPNSLAVFGTLDLDERERRIIDFADGKFREMSTKPEICGAGPNWQRHCHEMIFVGIDYKFHDIIQALHRTLRFGQTQACTARFIYTEAEREIRADLERKWAAHDEQSKRMSEIIRKYGLGHVDLAGTLKRKIGVPRKEARGERYSVVNNDAVDEAKRSGEASVDLIITSVPFANHYEYTTNYEDFGHTDNNDHFWAQMDFLTPELLRILRPGRLACIHVKDRVLFGNMTGAGLPTISPFHAEAIFHYRRHGFDYCGAITVVTDVVRENNGNYRLGYTEMCKDGTKVGVGSPEYVLLFHKPQSDRSKSYADLPVRREKSDYSLARWQIDAHAFWRSSGQRLLTPEELAALPPDKLAKLFREQSRFQPYDYDRHVTIGEALEVRNALPSSFMALAPGSFDPMVWDNINRMRTLNGEQLRRNVEFHICPLQFDIVDRCIERFSNRDELVYDPFGGIGTVPVRAILKGRRGKSSELSEQYWRDSAHYCADAERQASVPTLFDFLPAEGEAA